MEGLPPEARGFQPEALPFQPERVQHYQSQAERLLNRYGRDFARFTIGYEQLVALGDERLQTIETTGYNIVRRASDMPLASRRPLLFYGNYSARTRHFGLLLAAMEHDGVITPEQVRFGVRGTRVLHDPAWGYEPDLTQLSAVHRTTEQGERSEHAVLQSVETVVTFAPTSERNALEIAHVLNQRTRQGEPGAIEDSNVVPDIRATMAVAGSLRGLDFMEQAQANILTLGQAQVIALRQATAFPRPWRAVPVEANADLVGYLATEGVLP